MKLISLSVLIVMLLSCADKVDKITDDIYKQALKNTLRDQTNKRGELFDILEEKDSLLFQIGFNQIDTNQVASLTADDFEFYHDENGITESKADFILSIQGIADLPFKTWRILKKGSLEVFPLYKNNRTEIYGAIQNGIHDFYQQEDGEKAKKTNTARFTHLWIIEDGEWKLKRVLSFDHHVPE